MNGWMNRGTVGKVEQDEKRRKKDAAKFFLYGKNTNNVFTKDEKGLERVTDGRPESYNLGTED